MRFDINNIFLIFEHITTELNIGIAINFFMSLISSAMLISKNPILKVKF